MGRSSRDHARSAVSTSAGVLRTVKARQQQSPNDNPRPPAMDRIAPASSASASVNGSIVTPAAASNSRIRRNRVRLVSSACRADVDWRRLVRKIIAAGALAFSLAMTTGVGISNADQIPVEGNYPTQTACLNDGMRFGPSVDAQHVSHWMLYTCEQHNDGLWYLYLIK